MPNDAENAITSELSGMIKKANVDVPAAKSGDVADQIVAAVKKSDTIALAQVESPFLSTINITQLVGIIFAIVAMFGFEIPPEVRAQILTGIVSVMAVVTWILKTFFAGKVTWASAQV